MNRPLILRDLFLVIDVFHMQMQACPDQRLVFFGMDEVDATSATVEVEVGLEMLQGLAPKGRIRYHRQAKRWLAYAAASAVPWHGADRCLNRILGLTELRRDVPCE